MAHLVRRLGVAAVVLGLVAGVSGQARAGQIYIEGSNSELATLDPTTGTINLIGSTSVQLYGLGFGPSATLFGLGSDDNLYSVNTSTAALTLIGSYTGNFNSGATMGSASDGTLYSTNGVGDIWTVNNMTGAATVLGNMGVTTNSNPSGDGGSGLYIVGGNDLYSINRATGSASLIGAGSYGEIYGLAYTGGTMYAIEGPGTGIYALNLSNGQSTLVSNYSQSAIGEVYAAAAISTSAVPEPSSVTLLSGVGMVGIMAYMWRRRKAGRA